MVNYLRLSEKLKDLRKERYLNLAEVAENIIVDDVPISASTLQRLEDTEKTFNTGYKEIIALAKFYDVSADIVIGRAIDVISALSPTPNRTCHFHGIRLSHR